MPPVTGTEGLGTPILKNGQRSSTAVSPIPRVTPKASLKLSEDKRDLYDYFKKVEPAAKASPKTPEDKKDLYDYFRKVKPAAKTFKPSEEVTKLLEVRQAEGKDVESKVGDPNEDCKATRLTRKRKHSELKNGTVYDQNKNATNVLVSLENSCDKLCENGEEGKGVIQLSSSDVGDFEDEIEILCDAKKGERYKVKPYADKKKSKHHTKLKKKSLLSKKKDVQPLDKKENHPGIKKGAEEQETLSGAKREKFCTAPKGIAETSVSGKGERKYVSVKKEEHKDTSSKIGNENPVMTQERAQNQDVICHKKNGKDQAVRQIKSLSEPGCENSTKLSTFKDNGSLNKTNAFAFMMSTRHKQDEAIQQMRLKDACSSGNDDLEILEHKKAVESPRPSSSTASEIDGKKDVKTGTNAFALLMTKRQTPKKEEEVTQIAEITISDSDSEAKDENAESKGSKVQGEDDMKSQKRKAENMDDSLNDFELGVEKRKKKASKKGKKSIDNTSGSKSKGTVKSNTKPETIDSVWDSKVQIPEIGEDCKSNQGHINSAKICGLTGSLRGVEVISFQDYMRVCKKLLVSESQRETSDIKDVSGELETSKASGSCTHPDHCKGPDVGFQITSGKMNQSVTGLSLKARTGLSEKAKTDLSKKTKTDPSEKEENGILEMAKTGLAGKGRTNLSKKSKIGLSEKLETDLAEKSETYFSETTKTDQAEKSETGLSKKSEAGPAEKVKTGLSEIHKTGMSEKTKTNISEKDNSEKALTTNSENVISEPSEETVTSHSEKSEFEPSEKNESVQEKANNPKKKSISSFFKKLTKEESLQERSKIITVADVHATAEGSSTSPCHSIGQAKGTKAKELCAQNTSHHGNNVPNEEVKAGKNKTEIVTPRRNARRKTRSVQEELEKIELLEQVTISEGGTSSQDKMSGLFAYISGSSSTALNAEDQSCSTLVESKAKEGITSLKNNVCEGSAVENDAQEGSVVENDAQEGSAVENNAQEGSTLIVSEAQDDVMLNIDEKVTSENMPSCQGILKKQIEEEISQKVSKQEPVKKAKQMLKGEPRHKSGKPEQTPKNESKQVSRKKFKGKTAVGTLTSTSEEEEPKLGRGRRSKKLKKPFGFEKPPKRASEEPGEPEDPSCYEDSKPQEDSCSSSWENTGNEEDKENVVRCESALLEKPGNRISLRLRRLPQTSYVDKRKKVLAQIQGTTLSHSHSKVKAKALLSKAKSGKASPKTARKKKTINLAKKRNAKIVGMMEIDLTGDESDHSDVCPQEKGKTSKKSQLNGKKKLGSMQKKPKKGTIVKEKTSFKQKEGHSKKVKSKASKNKEPEKSEAVKTRPERKAAVNARRVLTEDVEIVGEEGKAVKAHKSKGSQGQSQKGTTKLAPIFMKKDSEKVVEVLKVLSPTKLKARREFLMSGLPTEIKLQIALEKSLEMNYGPVFPEISHVQQRNDGCEMWNLPAPQIEQLLETSSTPSIAVPQNVSIFESKIEIVERRLSVNQKPAKLCVNGLSRVLTDIKEKHPGVPVYSLFKSYLERKKEKLLQYKKEAEREKQQKSKKDVVVIDLDEEETSTGRKRKRKRRSGPLSKRAKTTGKGHGRRSLGAREGEEEEEVTAAEEEEDPWNERTPYMWTSLFAPRNGQEVIGNKDVVKRVRVWLLEWKKKCEVEARREMKGKKKNRKEKDDFLTSDESNGFSDQETEDNTLLLSGPSGVGKSALVYAMAKELGYKVLEVNASSKRNGKHVISRLAEATQSHTVSNSQAANSSQANTLMTMFASKASSGETSKLDKGVLEALSEDSSQESGQDADKKKAMSLVLFEDIDIVFEDADEGFLSAVQSFMATTKRPIVLTTSQATTPVLSKIKGEYEHLQLQTPDTAVIALHAQLACLAEGVCADARDLLCLVSFNCGDIRQSLLDLQLWSQSSGASKSFKKVDKTKLKVDDLPQPIIPYEEVPDLALQDLFPSIPKRKAVVVEYQQGCTFVRTGRNLMLSTLTSSNISLLSLNPELVHTSLPLISHLPLKVVEEKRKKYPLDANDPCVKMTRLYEKCEWLSLDDEEDDETIRAEDETDKKEEAESDSPPPEEVKVSVRKCMDTFSKLFETLAFHDLLDTQTQSSRDLVKDSQWWSSTPTAGLSSLPSSATYNGIMQDTMVELEGEMTGHAVMLWNQELEKAVEGTEGEWKQLQLPWSKSSSVTTLMTGKADFSRFRSNSNLQRSICDKIPLVSRWNHRSFSLDYLPSIRAITRMDELAAVVCEKRRARRFLSHLSQQSIHLNPEDRTTLANVMQL